jgi:hypothetical protein
MAETIQPVGLEKTADFGFWLKTEIIRKVVPGESRFFFFGAVRHEGRQGKAYRQHFICLYMPRVKRFIP